MSKQKLNNINGYLPQLRADWEKELFERTCKVLADKGIVIQNERQLTDIFKNRMKREAFEGTTTLILDGVPICCWSELTAEPDGHEIKTSYKFAVI